MDSSTSPPPSPQPSPFAHLRRRPPLGLPPGSVRAILTLLVVAVVVVEVLRKHEVESLWTETLMIALAHYFSSRRFIHLAPEVVRRLELEGHLAPEPRPLFLPRGSIRVLLVLAFAGLAAYLYYDDRLLHSSALSILGVVFAYLLGVTVQSFMRWWTKGKAASLGLASWEDIKAVSVLFVTIYTAGIYLSGHLEFAPHAVRNVALGLVLFYFGSR